MRVLVSGFQPFAGRKVNASWELARSAGVLAVRLPVEYGRAWPVLESLIGDLKPDAVVALGECPGRHFRLERTAVNLRGSDAADNRGKKITGEPLSRDGPAAYLSSLPLERLDKALGQRRIPGRISLCAGTYLCNEVFYYLMREHARRPFPGGAGFIHVPRDAHRAWPGALAAILAALKTGGPRRS